MQYDAYNCHQLAEETQRIMPPKPPGSKTVGPPGTPFILTTETGRAFTETIFRWALAGGA